MHGRWSVPVRLRVNRWSLVMLIIVFAASASAMPPRSSTPEFQKFSDEDDEVREELEAIKERILSDLGMSKMPDMSMVNVSAAHMDTMLELYRRSVLESEQEEREHERAVLRFYSYAAIASSEHTIFPLGSNSTFKRVLFPLHTSSSLRQKGRHLQSAKLRVPVKDGWSTSRILIYRLLEEAFTPNSSRTLVTDQVVEPTLPHHFELDVSDTVRQWLDNPELNFGLLLECQGCWNVSAAHQEHPVLDILISEVPPRIKRSNGFRFGNSDVTTLDCSQGFKTRKCCRRSFTVSFRDMGWDWILNPVEFEAYFCKGRCHYPSTSFANTHALLQGILYKRGYKVPRPCCVPKKLRALNLLHFNDKTPPELTITRQKGMIVKECACF